MTESEFREQLTRAGYASIDVVEWQPGTRNEEHGHAYAAYALVLGGGMTLTTPEGTRACGPGDTFCVPAGVRHTEIVGPEGVRFVVGRK